MLISVCKGLLELPRPIFLEDEIISVQTCTSPQKTGPVSVC